MSELINSFITVINDIGRGFCSFAGSMFIQSSVLILLLLIIDLLIRKNVRATFRYWIWMLVFIKLVLPPTLSSPTGIGNWFGNYFSADSIVTEGPANPIQYEPAAGGTIQEFTEPVASVVSNPPVTTEAPVISEAPALSTAPAVNALTWQGVAFLLWFVGVLVISVLLIQRIFFVKGLIAQSKPAQDRLVDILDNCRRQVDIRRNIRLRLSHNVTSPAVCGLFNPVILMPKTLLEQLSREKLRAILIHELAHIKRGDLWINCVQTFLQIAYFYNPFVWLANMIIRRIREQAVDEMVLVALGGETKGYSNTLIDIAEMAFSRPALSLRLVGVVESKKALSHRIKHIVYRPLPKSAKLGILGLFTVIIAAAILLPMAKAEKETTIATLPNGVTGQLIEGKYPDTGYIIPANVPLNRIRNHELNLFHLNEKHCFGFRKIRDYQEFLKYALQFGGDIYYYFDKKEKTGKAVFPRQNYWEREQTASVAEFPSITLKNLPLEITVGTVDGREYKIRFSNLKTERLETLIGPWDGKRLNPKDQCIIQYYCTNDATFILPSSDGKGFNSVIENVLTKKENRVFDGIYCAICDGDKIIVYCNYNDPLLDSIFDDKEIAKELQLERIADNKWQIKDATVYLKSFIESDKQLYLKNNPEAQLWQKPLRDEQDKQNVVKQSNPQSRNSDFAANLPNGVTVELVGVCEHPSEGKRWWKPDGTELKDRPYDTIAGKLSCSESKKPYEFAVSFKNFPKGAVAGIRTEPMGSSVGGSVFSTVYKEGKEVRDVGYLGTCLDRNLGACTVIIISASGEWKTLVENTDKKGSSSHGVKIGLVAFSQIFEEDGKSTVTVTHSITRDYDERVIAIDGNGNEQEPRSVNTAGGGEFDQMVVSFDLKPDNISKFLFQTRPYELVTFKNVSLQPGVKTDVQVEVGKPTEQPVGKKADVLFGSVDFEGYFEDSTSGGKALEQLWNDRKKDLRDANEILEITRKGLRRYHGSGNILRWIGNLFIWGKNPQNHKAIELMYHASGSPDRGLYGDAIYFGLSVTNNKTSEILQAMVSVAMKTDDYYNVTGRILWGCRNQKDELIACLEPYLSSDETSIRQKARDVKDYFIDSEAFMKKRAKLHEESIQKEYGDELENFKDRLLNGNSKTRLDTLKQLNNKGIMSIVDESFLDAFEACTKDANSQVRTISARTIGSKFIWGGDPQNQRAIQILIKLLDDPDRSTRYAAVYYGLSTVRNPSKEIVRKMLATILDDREINYYGRVIWGIRRNKQDCVEILEDWMNHNEQDSQCVIKAYEIYEDVTAEQLPEEYARRFADRKSDVHEGVVAMCFQNNPVSKEELQKQFIECLTNGNQIQKVLEFYVIETRETAVGLFVCDNLADRNTVRNALMKDNVFHQVVGYMHGRKSPAGSGWIDSLNKFRERNKHNRVALPKSDVQIEDGNSSMKSTRRSLTAETDEASKDKIILQANVFSINAPQSLITDYLRDKLGVNNTVNDLTQAQAAQFKEWVATLPDTTMISSPSAVVFDGRQADLSVTDQKEYTMDYEKTSDSPPQYKPKRQKIETGVELFFIPELKKKDNLILLTVNLKQRDLAKIESKTHESGNQIQIPVINMSEIHTQVAVPIGKYFLVSVAGMYSTENGSEPDQPVEQTILLVKADCL